MMRMAVSPVDRKIAHQHITHCSAANGSGKCNDQDAERIQLPLHSRESTGDGKGKSAQDVDEVEESGIQGTNKIVLPKERNR